MTTNSKDREAMLKATKFSNFCQKFKMLCWDKNIGIGQEADLDKIALEMFDYLPNTASCIKRIREEVEEMRGTHVDFIQGKLEYVDPPPGERSSSHPSHWHIPSVAYKRAIDDILDFLDKEDGE